MSVTPQRSSRFWAELSRNRYLYLLTVPGLLLVFVFAYLPMIGVVIAFQDFNPAKGILGSPFVGLKNFDFFFESGETLRVIGNTLFLNSLFILSGLVVSISLAIMFSEVQGKGFKKVTQTLVTLPYFLSWTVIAMFSTALLATDNGVINQGLSLVGVPAISFYNSPDQWPVILVLIRLWQGAGFGSIVYLATITGISPEIYESAAIDGASRWMMIRKITLPLLKPTAVLMVLLAVGNIFYGDLGMILSIVGTNPILYPTTDVIDTYVYRALMELGDMSMAAAVGLFQSVVGFLFVLTVNTIAKRLNPESALF